MPWRIVVVIQAIHPVFLFVVQEFLGRLADSEDERRSESDLWLCDDEEDFRNGRDLVLTQTQGSGIATLLCSCTQVCGSHFRGKCKAGDACTHLRLRLGQTARISQHYRQQYADAAA